MSDANNPFNPPAAQVGDYQNHFVSGGELVLEGIAQPAGAGVEWLKESWALFSRSAGLWIGITVALLVITMVVGMIPFLGFLANTLLTPVFIAGIILGCKAVEEGEALTFGHLFAGFSTNIGNLILIGLLYLVGMIVIFLIVGVAAGLAGFSFFSGSVAALNPMLFLLIGLIGLLCIIPLVMAIWHAPALVVVHNVPPVQAMKSSFFGCLKNFIPFLVYGVVLIPLSILAMIPLGLGLLVLFPMLYISMYASYKSIFIR